MDKERIELEISHRQGEIKVNKDHIRRHKKDINFSIKRIEVCFYEMMKLQKEIKNYKIKLEKLKNG